MRDRESLGESERRMETSSEVGDGEMGRGEDEEAEEEDGGGGSEGNGRREEGGGETDVGGGSRMWGGGVSEGETLPPPPPPSLGWLVRMRDCERGGNWILAVSRR